MSSFKSSVSASLKSFWIVVKWCFLILSMGIKEFRAFFAPIFLFILLLSSLLGIFTVIVASGLKCETQNYFVFEDEKGELTKTRKIEDASIPVNLKDIKFSGLSAYDLISLLYNEDEELDSLRHVDLCGWPRVIIIYSFIFTGLMSLIYLFPFDKVSPKIDGLGKIWTTCAAAFSTLAIGTPLQSSTAPSIIHLDSEQVSTLARQLATAVQKEIVTLTETAESIAQDTKTLSEELKNFDTLEAIERNSQTQSEALLGFIAAQMAIETIPANLRAQERSSEMIDRLRARIIESRFFPQNASEQCVLTELGSNQHPSDRELIQAASSCNIDVTP